MGTQEKHPCAGVKSAPQSPPAGLSGTSVRQLYLVDNMSVALAFERRRAHVHSLLVHIGRFAALCLCCDVFATVW